MQHFDDWQGPYQYDEYNDNDYQSNDYRGDPGLYGSYEDDAYNYLDPRYRVAEQDEWEQARNWLTPKGQLVLPHMRDKEIKDSARTVYQILKSLVKMPLRMPFTYYYSPEQEYRVRSYRNE